MRPLIEIQDWKDHDEQTVQRSFLHLSRRWTCRSYGGTSTRRMPLRPPWSPPSGRMRTPGDLLADEGRPEDMHDTNPSWGRSTSSIPGPQAEACLPEPCIAAGSGTFPFFVNLAKLRTIRDRSLVSRRRLPDDQVPGRLFSEQACYSLISSAARSTVDHPFYPCERIVLRPGPEREPGQVLDHGHALVGT